MIRDVSEVLWCESTWRKVLAYVDQKTPKIYMEKFWHLLNFDSVGDIITVSLVLHLAALVNWIFLLSLITHERVLR